MKKFFSIVLSAMMAAITLWSCQGTNEPIRLQGNAQGTYYSIIYYDKEHRNLQPQIDSLLNEFDLTASLWVDSSLVRRVNQNEDSVVTPMMKDLVEKSIEINDYTHGAFDCTVGKLVRAWGFGFDHRQEMGQKQIDSLKQYIGGKMTFENDNNGNLILHKPHRETEIDFNAIAQGYSVDMIGGFFEQLGITNYLIDVGGEVLGKGHKANNEPWVVGIEKPAENKNSEREIEAKIKLEDCSVVTSGNYRKYYEKDGVRYSHTIDPSTGRPVEHTLLSASVIDKESWKADALATAFMVMGLERSLEFLKEHPEIKAAYFIYDDNGEYKTFATEGFKEIILDD